MIAWKRRIAFPPIQSTFTSARFPGTGELQQGVLDHSLRVLNIRTEACEAPAHVRIGWLRFVANAYHTFALQSFFDEITHARGMDPLDSFLELVGPSRNVSEQQLGIDTLPNHDQPLGEHPVDIARLRHVIERVAANSRWKERNGRALGTAAHRGFLTSVAVVVSRDDDGPHPRRRGTHRHGRRHHG